jgi:uncharacterized PurR-regulated membrane protein YhhQ (DUF165 family)
MNQVSENPVKNRNGQFFCISCHFWFINYPILTSNIMAVKLLYVFGLTWFDAGTITFPFAYMLGDVLNRSMGNSKRQKK